MEKLKDDGAKLSDVEGVATGHPRGAFHKDAPAESVASWKTWGRAGGGRRKHCGATEGVAGKAGRPPYEWRQAQDPRARGATAVGAGGAAAGRATPFQGWAEEGKKGPRPAMPSTAMPMVAGAEGHTPLAVVRKALAEYTGGAFIVSADEGARQGRRWSDGAAGLRHPVGEWPATRTRLPFRRVPG
ncbi:unnamed protein product, partial [Amoebophrya sp. A120]|eukprot:GSA120T00015731001.1